MRTLKLRTELTEDEIHDKSAQIAQLVGERKDLADAKRREAKRYKDKIDQKAKQIEELSEEVNTRHEMREVEVSEIREGKFVVTYRVDSGESVSKRKLTASEEEGTEDIGEDSTELGLRAAEGSRVPDETPARGRTVQKLLDEVDARDSLAFVEAKPRKWKPQNERAVRVRSTKPKKKAPRK